MIKIKISWVAFIFTTVFVCTPLLTQAQNPYQTRNHHLGVSGGNVKDITQSFCCSGTLGSLVIAGGMQYVLSNNHVLADENWLFFSTAANNCQLINWMKRVFKLPR